MKKYIPKIIGFFINAIGIFSPKYAAKQAIQLFSTPRKGRIKENEVAFLNTAIQDTLTYKDLAIKTYHWKGEDDTVLLVHGWESNTHRWKPLIEMLLKKGYNIVSLDAPAHGATSGTLFNAILYSECINTVAETFKPKAVIGHSVGGMASVFFQKQYKKDFVEKLVLLGAPADFTGVFGRYEDMMGYKNHISKALEQYILEKFNYLPEYFSTANFSKDIKVKGLIIHDKKDRIIPYADGLKMRDSYNNSKFITTNGYGHGLKHQEVHNHILAFLNT